MRETSFWWKLCWNPCRKRCTVSKEQHEHNIFITSICVYVHLLVCCLNRFAFMSISTPMRCIVTQSNNGNRPASDKAATSLLRGAHAVTPSQNTNDWVIVFGFSYNFHISISKHVNSPTRTPFKKTINLNANDCLLCHINLRSLVKIIKRTETKTHTTQCSVTHQNSNILSKSNKIPATYCLRPMMPSIVAKTILWFQKKNNNKITYIFN